MDATLSRSADAAFETELQVQRIRHPFAARHMQLISREVVSPGFVRITLGTAELDDFHSDGFDDHVKLLLPAAGQKQPHLPTLVDGRPTFDEPRPIARDFTPVRWDTSKGAMVLEFALHDQGPAAQWATQAHMGDWVGIAGPRGSMVIPTAYDVHVLLGDASALPAIERRLSELPAAATAIVRVRVPKADRRTMASAAQVNVQWVDNLIHAAEDLALPTDASCFVWAAGEHTEMAAVRRVLQTKGAPLQHMRIASYWKRGEVAHHEELTGA